MNRVLVRPTVSILWLSAAALTACSRTNPTQSVERHIEEGVEVVVSHAPAWLPEERWQIRDMPKIRIGADESLGENYVFSGISGATLAPDGRIVVADRYAAELRFFNADGTLLDVAGGQGEGPGEFPWILNLLRCDENAFHAVGPEPSISVFDFKGEFRQRVDLAQQAGFLIGYSFVCDRDRRLAVTKRNAQPVRIEGLHRSTANVFLLDLTAGEGGVIADLGSFPIQERLGGAGGSSTHPLGKRTSFAIFSGRTYIGTADRYEITVFSETGRPVRRIRRDVQPETLDEAAVTRYLETWGESLPTNERELMLRRFAGAEHPDAFPAYARLLADALGYLWVEGFPQETQSPNTWSVFAPDGIWLGDLRMPPRFHVLEIGEDYVLGRFTGELGQESIGLYALER